MLSTSVISSIPTSGWWPIKKMPPSQIDFWREVCSYHPKNGKMPLFYPPQSEMLEECLYDYVKKCILSKEQLKRCGYPYQSPEDPKKTICNPSAWEKRQCANERICSRCSLPYLPDTGNKAESCQYHKYRCKEMLIVNGAVMRLYPCCQQREGAPGCQWALCHVSSHYNLSNESFVSTEKKTGAKNSSNIYGLDCEMCYTLNGLEVTRVSVISTTGAVVYETYVLPQTPIIDYNTEFSGITAAHLKGVTVKLSDVQDQLLQLFNSDTILVGHALENDLKALRLIHENVVDTAVMFPHKSGWPYRQSLKSLAKIYLNICIQRYNFHHDSIEDARTCMSLLLYKIFRCI